MKTWFVLTMVLPFFPAGNLSAGEKPTADSPATAKTLQEAWARFEKAWTSSLDPMRALGDPVWRLQLEALVLSVKAGKEGIPVLDNLVNNGSPAVKRWAGEARNLVRSNSPEVVPKRRALAEFDLAKIDTARYGEPAPDFELTDLTGKTWKLSQFKGKKAVALVFLGYAG